MPGTDTTLMPLIEAPIIPKATTYHGERWLAEKKVSFDVLFLDVRCPTPSKIATYISSIMKYISLINKEQGISNKVPLILHF
jgi:hypothetical protein